MFIYNSLEILEISDYMLRGTDREDCPYKKRGKHLDK